MFSKILIPIDGSVPANRAAKFGLELAGIYDAAVELLHVVGPGASDEAGPPFDDVLALDTAGDPDVETTRVEGTPNDAIADRAASEDVDLLVMGRYSRTGVTQHLLGSTTERVLRQVDVPVLTVRGNGIDAETGRSYENVLLTTDGSDVAEAAAPYGADVARQTGARLHLLTVVDVLAEAGVFDAGGVSEEFVDRLHDEAEDALDSLADAVDASDLDVRSSVVEDRTIDGIEQYTAENDVDLLVVASEGETNFVGQRLGSTTSSILSTIDEPVLVVPVSD